jgi:hypothetical protein
VKKLLQQRDKNEKPNLNWGVDAPGLIKKSKQIVK